MTKKMTMTLAAAVLLTAANTAMAACVAPTATNLTPHGGPEAGGTRVTLTGTNFVAPVSVTFDGKAATSVIVVSPTQITAVSPAHAYGNAAVIAHVSNCGSVTFSPTFSFNSRHSGAIAAAEPLEGRGLHRWLHERVFGTPLATTLTRQTAASTQMENHA